MSSIQQDNKGPSPPPPLETKMADQSDDGNEGNPLPFSSEDNHNQEDSKERGDFRTLDYMDAFLEIILEILITISIVNILATLFPAVQNLVGVGLIVTLVIVLMEVFQYVEKIQKPSEFIKKKLVIYTFLLLGSFFLVTDAIDKVDNYDKIYLMTHFQSSSCPAAPNPFLVDPSIKHSSFQSSLSPAPTPFIPIYSTSELSELDVIMRYVLSLGLLFTIALKSCVLLSKVDFDI